MMSNLPELWLANATVVLANGCVRRLLLEVSIDRIGAISPPSLVTSVLKVIKRKVLDHKSHLSCLNLSLAVPLQSFLSSGTSLTARSIGMMSMVVS